VAGIHRPVRTGGDDAGLRSDHRELQGGALAPLAVERADELEIRQRRQFLGDDLRVLQEFTHPHLDRGMRQLLRIAQSLADFHLEPAVDPAIDELQRKVVDDQDGRHRECAEDRDRAPLQARSRHVPPVIAHQTRKLGGQQHEQGQQPRDVDEQNPRQPLLEQRRVLHRFAEQVQRHQPQHHADGAQHGRTVLAG
jgi:hypothetical protein